MPEEFEKRVLKCVDDAMDTFGENVRRVVYYYLERNFNLKSDDIVEHPQEFIDALRSIFASGIDVIERIITERIKEEFGIELSEWSFAKAVEEVRKSAGV